MATNVQPPKWTFSGAEDGLLDSLNNDVQQLTDSQVDQALATTTNTFNGMVSSLSGVQSVKLPTFTFSGSNSSLLQAPSLATPTVVDWSSTPSIVAPSSIEYTTPEMGALQTVTMTFTPPPPAPSLGSSMPSTPGIQAVNPNFPEPPPGATIGSVGSISVRDAPTFNVDAPNIDTIQAPTSFSKSAPSMETLVDRTYPDAPGKTLPTVPTARNFDLPTAPTILNFEFSGTLPNSLESPPDLSFNYTEVIYASDLLDSLKTKIFDLVHTARQTGLNEVVKQAIINDGHVRADSTSAGYVNRVSRHFNRMGWELPEEATERLLEAQEFSVVVNITNVQNDNIILSELEQQSFVFAIGKSVELEGKMIELHNRVQQRSFDAAKAMVSAAVTIYKLKASYFNTAVLLYEAQATVYKSKIQAALSQVELYKAQIEAQKLIGEVNSQLVELYKAQVEAVISLHEIYKAELEAVKTKLEGDALKIKQFEMAVEAFSAEIQAKALEYDGYKAAMTGEELKAKIYNSLVNAFGSQIEAFSSGVDAQVLKLDADIKANIEAPLQISEQAVKEFVAIIGAESKYLKAVSKSDNALVDVFSVLVDAEKGRVSNLADAYSAEVAGYKAGNAGIEAQAKLAASINDTNTSVYRSEVAADVAHIESVATLDAIKVGIIKAITEWEIANAKIDVANYRASTEIQNSQITTLADIQNARAEDVRTEATKAISRMEASLDIAETEMKAAMEEKESAVKVMIASAQSQAQIIAAKAATTNIHKSFSDTTTESTTSSVGHYSYSENDSTTIQG